MEITVQICDHCGVHTHGKPFTAYRIGENGPLQHICSGCEAQPFRRVPPSPKGKLIAEVVRAMAER